ncbi:MAG: hypothetical protein SFU85_01665 [Candidatus Methylacidiphilales bacterium]|nr:hypothetical protein [Candidatus Methylacidiphilales bacterium]
MKTRAVQQGVTLKDLLANYIEAGLRRPFPPEKDGARTNVRPPLPVAIPRVPGAPLHPALTNAELDALLDGEDAAHHRRVLARPSTSG